jgi:hypothetical protein
MFRHFGAANDVRGIIRLFGQRDQQVDRPRLDEKRQPVIDGARRRAAAVPATHHVVEL